MAGYIGYVGRQYIMFIKGGDKPTEKEIIIDVPKALQLAWEGATWPIATIQVRTGSPAASPPSPLTRRWLRPLWQCSSSPPYLVPAHHTNHARARRVLPPLPRCRS